MTRTLEEYHAHLLSIPRTPEAYEAADRERAAELGQPYTRIPYYPMEWYRDLDNRLAGKPTGHLRFERRKIIWVPHTKGNHDD